MANQKTSLPLPEERERERERVTTNIKEDEGLFVAVLITWGLCLNAQLF
jgi:hypothetical protein